jgi:hypothetical protein
MRLGSFGACVWIKGTMAKLLHVHRFADQHCAKTAHSHDLHGHSARLAPKLKGTQRRLSGVAITCHRYDDISLFMSLLDIPKGLSSLLQGIASINDRSYLSRLNKLS